MTSSKTSVSCPYQKPLTRINGLAISGFAAQLVPNMPSQNKGYFFSKLSVLAGAPERYQVGTFRAPYSFGMR